MPQLPAANGGRTKPGLKTCVFGAGLFRGHGVAEDAAETA